MASRCRTVLRAMSIQGKDETRRDARELLDADDGAPSSAVAFQDSPDWRCRTRLTAITADRFGWRGKYVR